MYSPSPLVNISTHFHFLYDPITHTDWTHTRKPQLSREDRSLSRIADASERLVGGCQTAYRGGRFAAVFLYCEPEACRLPNIKGAM
jgi:hypothetical protein